jgi:hypothetical protein
MTLTTLTRPMLLAASAFVAAGGWVHLREWLDTYRAVPADAPGAWLVRIGFPVHAGLSALAAVAVLLAATRLPSILGPVLAATAAFQAGALATVVATRTGTVFGWTEPSWTLGAEQSRALGAAALVALAVVVGLRRLGGQPEPAPRLGPLAA